MEKKLSVFILIIVVAGSGLALAFTGPSQPPSGGSSQYWQLGGGANLYYTTGSVGINTSTPAYKLDVNGNIYTSGSLIGGTGICIGGSCKTSFSTIPSGMILFFNLPSCPSSWSEVTTATGRYIVGASSTETLAGTVGQALINLENRPVGQHTHDVNDPGHRHSVYHSSPLPISGTDFAQPGANAAFHYNQTTYDSGTGITLANSGTVAGTNAPYIQLLVCQKN